MATTKEKEMIGDATDLAELRERHQALKRTKKEKEEKIKLEKEIKEMEFQETGTGKFLKGLGKVVKFVKKELKEK